MRKYNVGNDFFTLSDMSKEIAKNLGFLGDNTVVNRIYRYLLKDIKSNSIKCSPYGYSMYKLRKSMLNSLTKRYKKII